MNYFHPLNFIRFILAIGVVLFHYGKDYYPFNSGWLHTLIINSSFRVSFFFFISGFVMCLVYAPQAVILTASRFYKKRLTRILPMYWLAFLLSLVLILFVLEASPKGLVIILHFLGMQSLYPGYVLDLNFTAWSISVELVFYALFPFLLQWLVRLPAMNLLVWTMVLWIIQSLQHMYFVDYVSDGTKTVQEFIDAFPLWHLVTFIGGMATARLILLEAFPKLFCKNALWVLLLCLAVFAYILFIPNNILKYIHNGLLMPLFALTVASLFYDRSIVHRTLSAKTVSRLGDLSYAIFIFQYPLWVICKSVAGDDFSVSSRFFFIYLAILLVFSWVINKFYEKPILGYLRGN